MSNVKSHLNKSGVTLEWITIILIFAIFILILLGCAGNFASRDLKNLYVSEFKDVRDEAPLQPVIFIPGILGSILVEQDEPNDIKRHFSLIKNYATTPIVNDLVIYNNVSLDFVNRGNVVATENGFSSKLKGRVLAHFAYNDVQCKNV